MTRPLLVLLLAGAALGACQRDAERTEQDGLDAVAREFVLLSLTIGEKEEGYIDAYYGPPELQAQAKAEAAGQSLEALSKRAADLAQRVSAIQAEGLDQRRARFLTAQLTAATTRPA